MAIIDGRFVKKNAETLKSNTSKELEVKIKAGGVLEKTVDGMNVKVNDTTTAADNLWSSAKVSDELSQKASTAYVDSAIAGLKWKEPVIDFKTQVLINGLTPLSGDRYIVTDGVNQNYIYQFKDGVTTYTPPADGWTLVRKSSDRTYTYDATTSAWLDIGGISQTEIEVVEEFTLSAQNIIDKKVTLTYTPVNGNYVKLDVVSGCAQDNGADFSVNVATKEVSWSGLGLDTLLEAGDVLRISYSKTS